MRARLLSLAATLLLAACVSNSPPPSGPAPGSGGSPTSTGGRAGSGGSSGTGGAPTGTGGAPTGTGGSPAGTSGSPTGTGGSAGTGGSVPSSDAAGEAAPSPASDAGPATPPPPGNSVCPAGRTLAFHLDFTDPRWGQGKEGVIAAMAALGTMPMDDGPEHTTVVVDAERGNALKVRYPAGSGSIACKADKQCVTSGGLVFRIPLPDGPNIKSALLSYWVKFDTDFEFVRGGKLPGLCGGACATGGRDVETDRFSIRYMWRSGGVAQVYSYLTNPPNPGYGLDMGVDSWRWQADGKWHHIQEELILNTGNAKDGIIRVWYDTPTSAKPTFEQKNLTYYDRLKYPDLGIDKLIFSTFHGGNDAAWSPKKDVHAYFADFQLCR
jgi:hypothetical protein